MDTLLQLKDLSSGNLFYFILFLTTVILFVQVWVLLLGGAGVSCGFALWGWKIIRCIGGGITYMSPSRGYCAQISAVAIGLLATRANLPVSTTHILIGSVIGVGLADNAKVRFCLGS